VSLSRIMKLFNTQKTSGTSPTSSATKKPNTNLLSKIYLAPFAMLSFLKQTASASSDNVYALEPGTNTQYSLNYETANFPSMRSDLIQYCNAIISSLPQAMYQHTSSPQCVSETGSLGPTIDLGIEVGKNLTRSFQVCLNQAMKQMCDEYYDAQDHNTGISTPAIIVISCIAGLICIGACIAVGCNKKPCAEDNASQNYVTAPSYPTGGVTVINVGSDTSRHDHSYDTSTSGDHHSHSSVTWNP